MVSQYAMIDGQRVWTGTPEEQAVFDAWYAKQGVMQRLSEIDQKSIRPSRAIATARELGLQPDQADVDYLASLEQEAAALRGQL